MALITRNPYGTIAVNNSVLTKMIIDELLDLDEFIRPCTKKGKLIRKGLFTGYNEFAGAVEIKENSSGISVLIYALVREERMTEREAEKLFGRIESDFELLSMNKPKELILRFLGIFSQKQLFDEPTEIIKRNS